MAGSTRGFGWARDRRDEVGSRNWPTRSTSLSRQAPPQERTISDFALPTSDFPEGSMASESKPIVVSSGGAELAASGEREVRQRSEWRAGLRVLLRNRVALGSIVFLVLIHLVAVAAPLIAPADPDFIQIGKRFQRPNAE